MTVRRFALLAWLAAVLGAASLTAERKLVSGVSDDGVLRESFLLPLGVFLIGIALLAFIASIVLLMRERRK